MYITVTLGVKTKDTKMLDQIMQLGIDSFRVNLSHMSRKDITDIIKYVKKRYSKIKIIGDLTGKKIRVSTLLSGEFKINKGSKVLFCTEDKYDTALSEIKGKPDITVIPLNIKSDIINNLTIDNVYIKDGKYRMRVVSRKNDLLYCIADCGVYIRAGKSCTICGIDRKSMDIPPRDFEDLRFLIESGADIVLLSFVSSRQDILEYKKYIDKLSKEYGRSIEIWAKVETKEGVKNIDEIMNEVDVVIFGRGDMSAEGGLLNIPIYQWNVISKLKKKSCKLIVATSLLNNVSMQGRPSVPELNDLFTMIKYGVYGFMLTSETSVLNNSISSVRYLIKSVKKYEKILTRGKSNKNKDG